MTADEAGVAHVLLGNFLLAGEDGLLRVDHDDMVARVDVVGENGLMLAPEEDRSLFRHATDDLLVGVNDVPLAFHLLSLGTKSFHREPGIKPCRTRGVKDFCGPFCLAPGAGGCTKGQFVSSGASSFSGPDVGVGAGAARRSRDTAIRFESRAPRRMVGTSIR